MPKKKQVEKNVQKTLSIEEMRKELMDLVRTQQKLEKNIGIYEGDLEYARVTRENMKKDFHGCVEEMSEKIKEKLFDRKINDSIDMLFSNGLTKEAHDKLSSDLQSSIWVAKNLSTKIESNDLLYLDYLTDRIKNLKKIVHLTYDTNIQYDKAKSSKEQNKKKILKLTAEIVRINEEKELDAVSIKAAVESGDVFLDEVEVNQKKEYLDIDLKALAKEKQELKAGIDNCNVTIKNLSDALVDKQSKLKTHPQNIKVKKEVESINASLEKYQNELTALKEKLDKLESGSLLKNGDLTGEAVAQVEIFNESKDLQKTDESGVGEFGLWMEQSIIQLDIEEQVNEIESNFTEAEIIAGQNAGADMGA